MLSPRASVYRNLDDTSFTPVKDIRPRLIANWMHSNLSNISATCLNHCPTSVKKIFNFFSEASAQIIFKPLAQSLTILIRPKKIIANLLMVPGNIILALAHVVAPIDCQGRLALPFIINFPIFAHPFLLMSDAITENNFFNRVRNSLTGATTLASTTYAVLFVSGTFIKKQIISDPNELIEILQQSQLSSTEKWTLVAVGYITALNVITATTNVMLHGCENFLNGLLADLKVRDLKRTFIKIDGLLNELESKPEEEEKIREKISNLEEDHLGNISYLKIIKSNKGDFCLDILGFFSQKILNLPNLILSFPTENAKDFPLVQGILAQNGLIPLNIKTEYKDELPWELSENEDFSVPNNKSPENLPPSVAVEKICDFLQLSHSNNFFLYSTGWWSNTDISYDRDIIAQIKKEYLEDPWRIFLFSLKNVWTGDERPVELSMLHHDLSEHYFAAVLAYLKGDPLPLPLLPQSLAHHISYFNKEKYDLLLQDNETIQMLHGSFANNTTIPLNTRMYQWNQTVFRFIASDSPVSIRPVPPPITPSHQSQNNSSPHSTSRTLLQQTPTVTPTVTPTTTPLATPRRLTPEDERKRVEATSTQDMLSQLAQGSLPNKTPPKPISIRPELQVLSEEIKSPLSHGHIVSDLSLFTSAGISSSSTTPEKRSRAPTPTS